MNFVGLVSGGKDSIYSICKLLDEGNKLVALVHIASHHIYSDSYMYQTVGSEVASLIGECFGVPMYIFKSECKTLNINLEYEKSDGDEVEDLYNALSDVLKKHQFQGISSGAIHSTYQKNRVEDVCKRLDIRSMVPIWGRDQKDLLQEMIDYGIDARIIKVASSDLGKECIGMNLRQIMEYMNRKNSKYGMNYCGEGGEYESMVFDCKYFKMKIRCGSYEILGHPEERGREGGVYYAVLKDIELQDKQCS